MKRLLQVSFIIGILLFISFLSLALWMAWNFHQNSPSRKVQEEIARLKREGEPMSLQEIAPPVPKHLDGTPLYRKAFAQLEEARRKFAPQTWQTYNPQVLQAAKPALQTLRKALDFPHMRLVDPKQMESDPLNTKFPQFDRFREFAKLLQAEAAQRKRRGDIKGAVESCLTILKLCRRIGDEPLLLAFLVQRTIFFMGVRGLWEEVLADADASRSTYLAALSEVRAWNIDRDFIKLLDLTEVVPKDRR